MTDAQDWRLSAAVPDDERLVKRLLSEHGGNDSDEVVVTHDGDRLFAYAASRGALDSVASEIEQSGAGRAVRIHHWSDDLDEWLQVEPPLDAHQQAAREQLTRDEEAPGSRTLVATVGRWVRAEVEQTMREWADRLGLELTIEEHPHLLSSQVLFTVSGPHRRIDEFADGLRAEEIQTIRTERAVMASPL